MTTRSLLGPQRLVSHWDSKLDHRVRLLSWRAFLSNNTTWTEICWALLPLIALKETCPCGVNFCWDIVEPDQPYPIDRAFPGRKWFCSLSHTVWQRQCMPESPPDPRIQTSFQYGTFKTIGVVLRGTSHFPKVKTDVPLWHTWPDTILLMLYPIL